MHQQIDKKHRYILLIIFFLFLTTVSNLSLNKYISFLILFISFQSLYAEEQIDIWNKELKEKSQTIKPDNNTSNNTINSEIFKKSQTNTSIKIENEILENSQDAKKDFNKKCNRG